MYEINYIKITFNNILSSDLAKRKKFGLICSDFPPNNIVWQLYYNKQTSVFSVIYILVHLFGLSLL